METKPFSSPPPSPHLPPESLAPTAPASTPFPPPPPPPIPTTASKRLRRRAREVSSRYLSTPISSPSSSPSFHPENQFTSSSSSPRFSALPSLPKNSHPKPRRTPSVPSSPDATDSESESFADENHHVGSVRRVLETPGSIGIRPNPAATQRRRAALKLFGENTGEQSQLPEDPKSVFDVKRRPRPGTPMNSIVDRTNSYRIGSTPRPIGLRRGRARPATPARVNSFQSEECTDAASECSSAAAEFSDVETCTVSGQGRLCDSPPLLGPSSSRGRPALDVRSSMPAAELLPTMSARRVADGSDDSCSSSRASNPLCYRSLNSALLNCQPHLLNPNKAVNKPLAFSRPPQPPNAAKSGVDVKKGKKAPSRQEDIHMLRLLDNCYVQWRFVNAKAQAAEKARSLAAEKSLYGLSDKLPELRESVKEKRIELEQWKRRERLCSILDVQMPYLDEWTILEGDYSSSLSGATKALQDASLRLPIIGNVKADVREIKVVLDSAVHMLESLSSSVQPFLPTAEGIEDRATDLARTVTRERALIEECGNLLSEAQNLQVKECSLRSQLIQIKKQQETGSQN
ncbi:uncharacterized protein [Typha angustifolia]|uniref:uncharacterized protein n=1 Tax=Typha angustifolia TaxID=59011 RepID=UPI003C2E4B64